MGDQVLDLPEKIRVTIPVELSKEQRALYVKAEKDMAGRGQGRPRRAPRRRRRCSRRAEQRRHDHVPHPERRGAHGAPASDPGEPGAAGGGTTPPSWTPASSASSTPSSTSTWCSASSWRRRRSCRAPAGEGLEVATYTGSVKPEERTAIEDAFQNGEYSVIVGTIAAMKEGITLTAADVEHFISRSWVPATNEQAEDRCHRVGQDRPVVINIYEAEHRGHTQGGPNERPQGPHRAGRTAQGQCQGNEMVPDQQPTQGDAVAGLIGAVIGSPWCSCSPPCS